MSKSIEHLILGTSYVMKIIRDEQYSFIIVINYHLLLKLVHDHVGYILSFILIQESHFIVALFIP